MLWYILKEFFKLKENDFKCKYRNVEEMKNIGKYKYVNKYKIYIYFMRYSSNVLWNLKYIENENVM